MATAATPLLRRTLGYYTVAFGVLVLASLTPWGRALAPRLPWFGLAWALLCAAALAMSGTPAIRHLPRWAEPAGLAGAFVVALVLRTLPQSRAPVPIGYDYGFYRAAMDFYASAAPAVPFLSAPQWIQAQFEPALLVTHEAMNALTGLDAHDHLLFVMPLLSAGLVLPVYALVRNLAGPLAALVASGIYATSQTQLLVHFYLYEKNVVALWILLVALLAFARGSPVAGGLLVGALGIWHRPTFLLAAAALLIHAAWDVARYPDRWKVWFWTALAALPAFLPVWLAQPDHYFRLAFHMFQVAEGNVGTAVPEGGGTFLDVTSYVLLSLAYLPLGAAALPLGARWPRFRLACLALGLAFANVMLRLVFFNRFIIMLDVLAVCLAAIAAARLALGLRRPFQLLALAGLLLLVAAPTVPVALRPPDEPFLWIDAPQHHGIEWMREGLPSDAVVLASNLHAPYVIADSGHTTYGPGLFDDPHNRTAWNAFFQATDRAEIHRFMEPYTPPVFVFHADGHGPGLGTNKFQEPLFTLVYDQGGARIWGYNRGG